MYPRWDTDNCMRECQAGMELDLVDAVSETGIVGVEPGDGRLASWPHLYRPGGAEVASP
jgi:hypothetical protein